MNDIKSKVQGIDANVKARDIYGLSKKAENIYEAISIIAKRSRHLSNDIKDELHGKLEEFAVSTETIEEIHENKEQIEISKFYEKLPNPTLIATEEFINGELEFRYRSRVEDETDENLDS